MASDKHFEETAAKEGKWGRVHRNKSTYTEVYQRPVSKKKSTRDNLNNQIIKDTQDLRLNKCFNHIIKCLEKKELRKARQHKDLLIDYMKRIRYKDTQKVLTEIFRWFIISEMLMFEYVENWTESENDDRILILLGIYNKAKETFEYEKSLYGADILFGKYERALYAF